MQRKVAQMLCAGRGDTLGERELEEVLGDCMTKIGYSDELVEEQVGLLRRARNFVATARGSEDGEDKEEEEIERELEKGMVSGEEESLEVSEEEVVDWRDSEMGVAKEESFGTDTPSAQDGKTTSTEATSGFFPSDLADFSHLTKRAKVQNQSASLKNPRCAARAGVVRH